MVKRLIDLVLASVAMILLAPFGVLAAVMIKRDSPGPVLYRARRVGKGGRDFEIFKFRTMAVGSNSKGDITGAEDPRVTRSGKVMRRLKVDEIPQLLNVAVGDMSVVGPRPESPQIVQNLYTDQQRRTLEVRPGLASPGSLYNYTHAEALLIGDDVDRIYATQVLPKKLALELYYVDHQSLWYDFKIIARTAKCLLLKGFGRRSFPDPPELAVACATYLASGETPGSPSEAPMDEVSGSATGGALAP